MNEHLLTSSSTLTSTRLYSNPSFPKHPRLYTTTAGFRTITSRYRTTCNSPTKPSQHHNRLRAGYPKWLPVLPVGQDNIRPSQREAYKNLDTVEYATILDNHGAVSKVVAVVHRSPDETQPSDFTVTLHIVADRSETGFEDALVAMVKRLHEKGLAIRVQIVDAFSEFQNHHVQLLALARLLRTQMASEAMADLGLVKQ